ncbi:MAG TPA: hypothetical protein VHQ47_07555 [Phycisphaerae bacterium]|nr:hypothetical protein [Phycisphaerae bacterium]
MGTIRRLCRDDAEALSLLDEATVESKGGDRKSSHIKDNNVTIDPAPKGNTRQQALRKLRKDAPEIHAEVLASLIEAAEKPKAEARMMEGKAPSTPSEKFSGGTPRITEKQGDADNVVAVHDNQAVADQLKTKSKPDDESGRVKAIAAAAVGMSRPTLEKAQAVMEAARKKAEENMRAGGKSGAEKTNGRGLTNLTNPAVEPIHVR